MSAPNLTLLRDSRHEVLSLMGASIEALTTDPVQQAELQGYLRELCLNYETELSLISSGKLPELRTEN